MNPDTEIILKMLDDYGMDFSPDDFSAAVDAVSRLSARIAELERLIVREVDPMEASAEDEAEYWRIHKRLNPENY